MATPKYLYVVDDKAHIPDEYRARQIKHNDAALLLRKSPWLYYLTNEDGEIFHRLKALGRDSVVKQGRLTEYKLKQPERMKMGSGHTFLLINASAEAIYHLFESPSQS